MAGAAAGPSTKHPFACSWASAPPILPSFPVLARAGIRCPRRTNMRVDRALRAQTVSNTASICARISATGLPSWCAQLPAARRAGLALCNRPPPSCLRTCVTRAHAQGFWDEDSAYWIDGLTRLGFVLNDARLQV